MHKTYTVYKITNIITKLIYIGQTVQKPKYRWSSHKRDAIKGKFPNSKFHNSIRKHGDNNFNFEIIDQTSTTAEELNNKEIEYIIQFDCCILDGRDNGYNMSRGGEGMDSTISSNLQKARKLNGTHTFAGENGTILHKKMLADGTHPSQIQHICTYCNKIGYGSGMIQHHFENCKTNPNRIIPIKTPVNLPFQWEVTNETWDGVWIVVDVMKDYCKKNNLLAGGMSATSTNKQEWHRGFKCRRIIRSLA